MHATLIKHFFTWGWLVPTMLPVLEVVGRAPLNIILGLYGIWGVIVLCQQGLGPSKKTKMLYLLIVLIFGLGLFEAVDPVRGIRTWLKFSSCILVYFLTCHALAANVSNLRRQFKVLAIAGVLTVFVLVVKGMVVSGGQSFVEPRLMAERNLPFLLPFLLFMLQSIRNSAWRRVATLTACTLFSLIIAYSGGRSALVGLLVALFIYSLVVFRFNLYYALIMSICILLLTASLGGVMMTRGLSSSSLSNVDLNVISSGRTLLWRQALTDWPENPVLGVGMGNVRYSEAVKINNKSKVRHLHNFLLDCWYETGFAGLAAYLAFLGSLLIIPFRCYRKMSSDQRSDIAPALAGTAALIAGGLFSYSYYSPQMTVYLFFLMSSLSVLGLSERTIVSKT